MSVVGVVLAAGAGTRMGGDVKQLLPLHGRPVLQHVLDAAVAAGLDDLVLVLGHAADRVAAAVVAPPGTVTVVNADHGSGQASSLRAGLAAAPAGAAAALVLLGDQPGVRPDAVRAVVAAHAARGAPVVRACYSGRPSHPVLLDRALWGEVARLRGDAGARALISAHAGEVERVEVGGEPPEDVDTPDDLARLGGRGAS